MEIPLALGDTWLTLWKEWVVRWKEWGQYAWSELRIALHHEKWLCAHVLIWLSLIDTIHHHPLHGGPIPIFFSAQKRKQTNEHDQPVSDVDTWLQEAQQANNEGAFRLFTRTIL